MNYTKLHFTVKEAEQTDILMAALAEYPEFIGFEEDGAGFSTYLEVEECPAHLVKVLQSLQEAMPFDWKQEAVEARNWNEAWESYYDAVEVDDFCRIRATFHEPSTQFEHELVITPKMSFGTGHHATTHMVVQAMRTLDFSHKSVLDYGTGTGILAILAARLGAADIDANDIDAWSQENAIENIALNQTPDIRIYLGDLDVVPTRQYDIILANINRNVLLDNMERIAQRLRKGGTLILSGFYATPDADMLLAAAAPFGLQRVEMFTRQEWAALVLVAS